MHIDPVFSWILTLALSQMFASAAWHKLRHSEHFLSALGSYALLPATAPLTAISLGLIAMELTAAIALIIPSTRALGGLFAIGLLMLYALAMAFNLWRGKTESDCGCYVGRRAQKISWLLVMRNSALSLVTLFSLWPMSERATNWIDFTTILFSLIAINLVLFTSRGLRTAHHSLSSE